MKLYTWDLCLVQKTARSEGMKSLEGIETDIMREMKHAVEIVRRNEIPGRD